MLKFNVVRDDTGKISYIETPLTGYDLLGTPKLNKGCGFTPEERQLFRLEGLLPPQIESLEQQAARMYTQYSEHQSNIAKNIYLNVLHDYNETLFYNLASKHLEEMLPIFYTPTIGEAVERFSLDLRKPRGLYVNYEDRHQIDKILENGLPNNIKLIVVTDGEAVLGIGDQGIGGIKICNAKLMAYTLCGGIDPHSMFPIQLDVGTNNAQLLNDPMYLGWRHERITGPAYDEFIDLFVTALRKKIPNVYLHWEDLGRDNARRILTQYREKICTINGDIQSTGAVALACVLAGCMASGVKLPDHRIVIFGAGTAGIGIADQIVATLMRHGLSAQQAYSRFWVIDKQGLLINDQTSLLPFQKPYARQRSEIGLWGIGDKKNISLSEVVHHIKPTILIGASAQGNAFTEDVVKTMAKYVNKPIIMPLSNPTTKAEAKPVDLITWTQGRVIIATGSPFADVMYENHRVRIAQSNNAFAFPGIGLGTIAVNAKHVSDEMIWAATETLSQCSPVLEDTSAPLLPRLGDILQVSRQVALAVAEQARKEGVAQIAHDMDLTKAINKVSWEPQYYPYKRSV